MYVTDTSPWLNHLSKMLASHKLVSCRKTFSVLSGSMGLGVRISAIPSYIPVLHWQLMHGDQQQCQNLQPPSGEYRSVCVCVCGGGGGGGFFLGSTQLPLATSSASKLSGRIASQQEALLRPGKTYCPILCAPESMGQPVAVWQCFAAFSKAVHPLLFALNHFDFIYPGGGFGTRPGQ